MGTSFQVSFFIKTKYPCLAKFPSWLLARSNLSNGTPKLKVFLPSLETLTHRMPASRVEKRPPKNSRDPRNRYRSLAKQYLEDVDAKLWSLDNWKSYSRSSSTVRCNDGTLKFYLIQALESFTQKNPPDLRITDARLSLSLLTSREVSFLSSLLTPFPVPTPQTLLAFVVISPITSCFVFQMSQSRRSQTYVVPI